MAGAGRLSALAASLLDRVRGSIPSGPVTVALSGGADSACCAWAAVAAGCEVQAITVDHGLPASEVLVAAAARIAGGLGIGHTVVPAAADGTDEGSLRDARYRAIEAAAPGDGPLLSGHTADDLAETTIGNLVRGAGAAGLAGIPFRRGRWHRPLLSVRRRETRAVAAELGLPFADDPGNTDPSIRRSLIRTEVVPMLERLNPSVVDAVVRAARFAAEDDAALESRAAGVPVRLRGGEVLIPAAALAAVPAAVAARVVRRGLRLLLDPYAGDLGDTAAVLGVAAGEADRLPVSGGLLAAREGPFVVVHPADPEPLPGEAALPVPGEARFGRWRITARPAPAPPVAGRRVVALAAGDGPLLVRASLPGETIAMAAGSKAVTDALREGGVPARRRPAWPVVVAAGRMVWVVGCRADPGAVARPGEAAVVLRAEEVA